MYCPREGPPPGGEHKVHGCIIFVFIFYLFCTFVLFVYFLCTFSVLEFCQIFDPYFPVHFFCTCWKNPIRTFSVLFQYFNHFLENGFPTDHLHLNPIPVALKHLERLRVFQKCKMAVKWVGSGRGTSILCQDDQLGTPEVLGLILANNSWKKHVKNEIF